VERTPEASASLRGPLAAEVYHKIRDQIAAGRFAPDAVVSEREWARLFNVGSRTPLREALKVLAGEGWIESSPRKGTRIIGLKSSDVVHVYEVRLELEGFGAFVAATRAGVEEMRELRRCVSELHRRLDEDNVPGFLDADLAIHRQVASMSANPWLRKQVESLIWSVKRLGQQSLMQPGRSRASVVEHEALLRSIENRDASGSRVRLQQHLLNSRDYALLTMESQRPRLLERIDSASAVDKTPREVEHDQSIEAVL
jgi:DNA-binding GntR family transcriptional regulator